MCDFLQNWVISRFWYLRKISSKCLFSLLAPAFSYICLTEPKALEFSCLGAVS